MGMACHGTDLEAAWRQGWHLPGCPSGSGKERMWRLEGDGLQAQVRTVATLHLTHRTEGTVARHTLGRS